MRKIGITGTAGSGKSYVCELLRKRGIFVLDLDVLAKEARDTSAKEAIVAMFGEVILSEGQIDVHKLGDIVFQNREKLKALEELIHPFVLTKMLAFFSETKEVAVVVEMAMLYEFGWENYFDEVWAVTCDSELALKRLVEQRNYTKEEAKRILSQQMSSEDKRKRADYVIVNNGDDKEIERQLDQYL